MSKRLIVVLGMHRSGTSLMTQILESAGLYCGNNLQPPGADNPNGYWEDLEVLRIDEQLLRQMNRDWSSLGVVSQRDIDTIEGLQSLRDAARDYLESCFQDSDNMVIKEPRMCQLLAFWMPIFEALSVDVHFVIIKRSLSSISQSLHARNQMTPFHACQLALEHWAQIAKHVINPNKSWCAVDYEDLGDPTCKSHIVEILSKSLLLEPLRVENALSCFDVKMNHSKEEDIGWLSANLFAGQMHFAEQFPITLPDAVERAFEQQRSMATQLNFWESQKSATQKIAQSLQNFEATIDASDIIVYGAGTGFDLVYGVLSKRIAFGVDRSVEHQITHKGVAFFPLEKLQACRNNLVVVTVCGRKAAIASALSEFNVSLVFIEDYFDDATNY